jgi:uncharacterized CHY-type Zn-finger protein
MGDSVDIAREAYELAISRKEVICGACRFKLEADWKVKSASIRRFCKSLGDGNEADI